MTRIFETSSYRSWQSHLMQIYLALKTNPKKVLEIGIGNKVVSSTLKNYCNVITADVDKSLKPDFILDISNSHDFNQFNDNSFDLIIICEVLEHVPYPNIDSILKSLSRITQKYVLISVPNQKNIYTLTLFKKGYEDKIFAPFFGLLNLLIKIVNRIGTFLADIHYRLKKKKRKFEFKGAHYWELGIEDYSEENFQKQIQKYFKIIKQGRIKENFYHHFFLLKKLV